MEIFLNEIVTYVLCSRHFELWIYGDEGKRLLSVARKKKSRQIKKVVPNKKRSRQINKSRAKWKIVASKAKKSRQKNKKSIHTRRWH